MALRINQTEFVRMSRSPTGPVGLFLRKQGVKIESVAKQLATDEKLVRTGRYRASIAWRLLSDGSGLVLRIGSAVAHARYIERGTPAHRILPRRPQYALWWTHGADRGWVVPEHPLAAVNHPGTRPYLILRRAVWRVLKGGSA